MAIHRLQVSGPKELGALLLPRHTLAFFESVEKDGGDLDIAIVVGARPAALLASQAVMPIDFDELEIAGALGGAAVGSRPMPRERYRRSRRRGNRDRR